MAASSGNCSGGAEDSIVMSPIMTNSSTNWAYTEGGYDYELLGVQDSRYECPICLLCLRDPVLTACGHKFCSGCIRHWVVNLGGKCPVDAVSLSPENIFPDNFTRREILQAKAKCPSSGCEVTLPINELERHIHLEHMTTGEMMNGTHYSGGGLDAVECSFKEFGCDLRVHPSEKNKHLDAYMQHHLHLMTMAYQRLKKYSSRPSLDHPSLDSYWRQDSRESHRWPEDSDLTDSDYEFRRQRSLDSLRFAQSKHNAIVRPRFLHSRVAESDESLCKPQKKGDQEESGSFSSTTLNSSTEQGSTTPQLNDMFERLVRLEQNDREKQIKMEKLQLELDQAIKLFSAATNIIKDLTSRYCHGVFVWTIHDFRKLCMEMRKNPNHVRHSPGFYTDTFGYKLCLRFNLTTPSSSEATAAIQPVDVPLEQDKETSISLYVHFMQGEFDDTLRWPFNGELSLLIIHPSIPENSIVETITAKPGVAYGKPNKPKNPTGVGYKEFCTINKAFLEGYVKNDSLVCKIYAKAQLIDN